MKGYKGFYPGLICEPDTWYMLKNGRFTEVK